MRYVSLKHTYLYQASLRLLIDLGERKEKRNKYMRCSELPAEAKRQTLWFVAEIQLGSKEVLVKTEPDTNENN